MVEVHILTLFSVKFAAPRTSRYGRSGHFGARRNAISISNMSFVTSGNSSKKLLLHGSLDRSSSRRTSTVRNTPFETTSVSSKHK